MKFLATLNGPDHKLYGYIHATNRREAERMALQHWKRAAGLVHAQPANDENLALDYVLDKSLEAAYPAAKPALPPAEDVLWVAYGADERYAWVLAPTEDLAQQTVDQHHINLAIMLLAGDSGFKRDAAALMTGVFLGTYRYVKPVRTRLRIDAVVNASEDDALKAVRTLLANLDGDFTTTVEPRP